MNAKILLLIVLINIIVFPQTVSKYGVFTIDNFTVYKKSVEEDKNNLLVDLEDFIPGIKLDIKYAGEDNFFGEKVYTIPKAYLRLPAATALREIQKELREEGYELKIFDAYRPYSATVLFYEFYEDTTYVASAYRGSRHNRGCAVDLTLLNIETGEEIKMPTEYDDFTEKAHITYNELPEVVIKNRTMLIEIMEKHGFIAYPYEWWHFDFKDWENFEIMDLNFEELEQHTFDLH
jgi:zinc D-Ala-D-Ala dipeptidase